MSDKETIELKWEQVEAIVRRQLIIAIKDGLKGSRDTDPELDKALLKVLSYYMTNQEYVAFLYTLEDH